MLNQLTKVWIFTWLVLFFAFYIGQIAYSFGIIAGFLWSGLTLMSYVWASCDLAQSLGLILNSLLLFMVILKVYAIFKEG